MTGAALFAGVIKLLIAALTQLLLRALIIPSAAEAAGAMLLRTGFIISMQSRACLRPKEVLLLGEAGWSLEE